MKRVGATSRAFIYFMTKTWVDKDMRALAIEPSKTCGRKAVYLEDMMVYDADYPIALTVNHSPFPVTVYLSPEGAAELIAKLSMMLAKKES